MSVRIDKLIQDVREESGLGSNQLWTDDRIARQLDKANKELTDQFINSYAHWMQKKFRFTLAGGNDGCRLDLRTIPDFNFQQGQWLNRSPDATPPETVDRLPSQVNRNDGSARRYDIVGDYLIVYPPSNSAGDYEIAYTPKATTLALPTTPPVRVESLEDGDVAASIGRWTVPFVLTDSDRDCVFTVEGSNDNDGERTSIACVPAALLLFTDRTGLANEMFGADVTAAIQQDAYATRTVQASPGDTYIPTQKTWSIDDAIFTDSDVGATIIVNLDGGGNRHLNREYRIAVVMSATLVVVECEDEPEDGQISPVNGEFLIDRRQLGCAYEMDKKFSPWSLYLTTQASIAIKNSRKMDTSALSRVLERQWLRITKMAARRMEGVRQAPITKGRFARRGGNYNGA